MSTYIGNMGFRLPNAVKMYARSKLNIVMMDYRGYGQSTGIPTEEGLNQDADCVLDFILQHNKLKNCPILLFGRSLGGAVSISLASRYSTRIDGIILENTFLSISDMVDKLMPWLSTIKTYVLNIKWDNHIKIQNLLQPILFISGDADQLVPPIHMKQLYQLALQSVYKDFYNVSGGTHNDTWEVAGAEYYRRLKAFADKCKRQDKPEVVDKVDEVKDIDDDNGLDAPNDDGLLSGNILPTMGTDFQVRQTKK
jgi:fermentation-respiration switch protein FrsA (DUF1100 family)